MKNELTKSLSAIAKSAFLKFVQLGFSGTLLSFLLIILLDFFHFGFCEQIPNIYFWKCSTSLWMHILFVIVFPFVYLSYAFYYFQKYLLYLFAELLIQKAKYKSLDWVISYFSPKWDILLKKLSFSLGISPNEFQTKQIIEKIIEMPFNQIREKIMPSLSLFYVLVGIQILIFLYLWTSV